MIDRRQFLSGAVFAPLLGAAAGVYSVAIEPNVFLDVKRYALTPAGWPDGLRLRLVVLSDFHAGEPFMSAARVRRICDVANALAPDAFLLLGDFNAGHMFVTRAVTSQQVGEALSVLRAPLGVHAVLGNHDWMHGDLLTSPSDGAVAIRRALRQAGVNVMENEAVALFKDGRKFWLAGLGDQETDWSPRGKGRRDAIGVDDLPGTLARMTDDAPAILMAHEPMIFRSMPDRVALTLCGHTHGGQVNLPLLGPVAAEMRFGLDLAYGHVQRGGRHLIISGGLGESILPVRFLRPPEIVEVTLG